MPTLVKRNDKALDALKSEYVKLFAPTTSWGQIIDLFLGLPGLRAYYPMNIATEGDDVYDMAGPGSIILHSP